MEVGSLILDLTGTLYEGDEPVPGAPEALEKLLDAGPFVAALEYASGGTATVVGKPQKPFFEAALGDLGLPAGEVAVVGDDPEADAGGAWAVGLRSV